MYHKRFFSFSDTIANNISFGLKSENNASEKITGAAKDADIYENIMGFEKGFETMLGERGINLSGGQNKEFPLPGH